MADIGEGCASDLVCRAAIIGDGRALEVGEIGKNYQTSKPGTIEQGERAVSNIRKIAATLGLAFSTGAAMAQTPSDRLALRGGSPVHGH
jgi:hypothetical protein